LFEEDPDTDLIVLIGEIGGTDEESVAEYIGKNVSKPCIAYLAGSSAPPGKQMGHAGAIVSQGKGTFESKTGAFSRAGIPVAKYPRDVKDLVVERLK
jgi:succinyl-CoA synthetase alpha subunit